jgi:hypothetical protein
MDGQRFDHLTKGFARAIGRRQALRTLGRVAVLGLITTAIGRDNARGQHSTCPYPCAAGLTCCNGRCWDTNTTQHHCGRCGNSCGPPLGTGGCCGGTCVNHATDPNHCGQCNRVCGPTEFCGPSPLGVPGCRACPAGQQRCGNACFDFRTDTRNCGGCGVVCTPGMECQNGRCTSPSYPPGQVACAGACTDLQTDQDHCGRCGHSCPSRFSICCDGRCLFNFSPTSCGSCGNVCPPGHYCCHPPGAPIRCVDVLHDANNCGDCAVHCPPDWYCRQGTCRPQQENPCHEGEIWCDHDCCPRGWICQPIVVLGVVNHFCVQVWRV